MSSRKNSTELMSQYPHKGIPLSKKKKKKKKILIKERSFKIHFTGLLMGWRSLLKLRNEARRLVRFEAW